MAGTCVCGCISWGLVSTASFCSVWRIRVSMMVELVVLMLNIQSDPSFSTLTIRLDSEDAPSGIG